MILKQKLIIWIIWSTLFSSSTDITSIHNFECVISYPKRVEITRFFFFFFVWRVSSVALKRMNKALGHGYKLKFTKLPAESRDTRFPFVVFLPRSGTTIASKNLSPRVHHLSFHSPRLSCLVSLVSTVSSAKLTST